MGLHVIGGIIANSYLLGPGSKMWKTEPNRFAGRIECAGLYWHFCRLGLDFSISGVVPSIRTSNREELQMGGHEMTVDED